MSKTYQVNQANISAYGSLIAIGLETSKYRETRQYNSWLGGSVVERRSLIGALSLVYIGPAADG